MSDWPPLCRRLRRPGAAGTALPPPRLGGRGRRRGGLGRGIPGGGSGRGAAVPTRTSFSGRSPRVLNACTAWSLSRVKAFSTTSWSHSVRSVSWSLAATWGDTGESVRVGRVTRLLGAESRRVRERPPRPRTRRRSGLAGRQHQARGAALSARSPVHRGQGSSWRCFLNGKQADAIKNKTAGGPGWLSLLSD